MLHSDVETADKGSSVFGFFANGPRLNRRSAKVLCFVSRATAFETTEYRISGNFADQLLVTALFYPAQMFVFPAVIAAFAIVFMVFSHIFSSLEP